MTMKTWERNVHEQIGWSNCANLRCRTDLGVDHVTLITTAHVRRFCSVECIAEGQAAWHEVIAAIPAAWAELQPPTRSGDEWTWHVADCPYCHHPHIHAAGLDGSLDGHRGAQCAADDPDNLGYILVPLAKEN